MGGVLERKTMKRFQSKFSKAIIATVAACAMLVPASVASAADSNGKAPGITVQQGAGYTATKISHPKNDTYATDGITDVDANGNATVGDGEADRGQNYSWSSVGYGDWMYVGTCYSAMGSTLKHLAVQTNSTYAKIKASLDMMFNGKLFLDSGENRSLLLKINTVTGEVKIVVPPIQKTTGGKFNVNGYRAAIEFHDKLYFAAAAQGTPYLLEVDPKDDSSKIVYQSGGVAAGISVGIRGLAVMGNNLIASMIGADGAYIVASSDPSAGAKSFKTIATQQDLFNYPAYHYTDNIFGGAIWDMVAFNNRLYITIVTGTSAKKQSFALVRGEEQADGSWKYTPLVGDTKDGAKYDFGFGATRSGAANLVVYKNHLYIGGYNDPMVALPDMMNNKFENMYNDMSNPVNLWRMDANENFELVAGADGDKYFGTPKGTIDGQAMRAGLSSEDDMSRHLNQYVWRMQSYDGKMYAGTFDISDLAYPVTQFANGDILKRTPEEWKQQIEYIKKYLEAGSNDSSKNSADASTSDANSNDADAKTDGDAASEDAKSPVTTQSDETAGKAVDTPSDAQLDKVERMESLMQDMSGDLESKQTDVSSDGTATMSLDDANTYTIEDREEFQKALEELLKLYQEVRPMLPSSITDQLDKWLTEDNVKNFTYFVGVCRYLSSATTDKRGFDLVVTSDGLNFRTITRNGLGDNNNHGLRVFAETNSGLSIGTANPYNGTQIWNLNDLAADRDWKGSAVLTAGDSFTYDKYDADTKAANKAGLNVGINFNGNTVESVEYNYQPLEEGKDYVINEDGSGITLTSAFLNAQQTGTTGSVTVKFNRGARARFTVLVKDSTPGVKPTNPSHQGENTNASTASSKTAAQTIASTGSNVLGMMLAAAMLVIAGGAVLLMRQRRK